MSNDKKHQEGYNEHENSDGEAENGWIVYEKDGEGNDGEGSILARTGRGPGGDGIIIHHERIILDDRPTANVDSPIRSSAGGSRVSGEGSMMASYLNITSYPLPSASQPSPSLITSSSSSTSYSPENAGDRKDFEFHSHDDHDRSLPSEDYKQDENETASISTQNLSINIDSPIPIPSIPQDTFSPPLKSDVVLSPTSNPSSPAATSEQTQRLSPSAQQDTTLEDENLQQDPQGPQQLEWWRRINGYGIAALVVGTASIVAYSMARPK